MNIAKLSVKIPALFLLISTTVFSADVQEAVQQLTGSAAKRYVSPIVSGIGANMNAGWYHKSPSADKFKFSIELGSVFMGTMLGEGDTHFDVSQSFRLTRAQADSFVGTSVPAGTIRNAMIDTIISRDFNMRLYGATIIGKANDSIRVVFNPPTFNIAGAPVLPQDTLVLPFGGVLEKFKDIPIPLFAPQFTIGTVFGTNLILRWLPTVPMGDLGDFKYFGIGIQHNPQVWMGSKWPVDVSASLFTQNVQFGTLMEASTFAMGINASKTFGWRILSATPYTGFSLETSTINFGYAYKIDTPTGPSTQKIDFDLKGDNKARLTMGLSLRLLILNINADYNLAKYPSYSLGLMFGY